MGDTFSPTVKMPYGRTVTPRSWMWVLGFALAGCDWAIKKASTEEFRQMVIDDIKASNRTDLLKLISHYEEKIRELKERLRIS